MHRLHRRLKSPPGGGCYLPPVKYVLERRRSRRYRQAHLAAMSAEDTEAFVAFINKTTAWLFVAGGGALLALTETFELAQRYHWNNIVFWLLLLAMSLLTIGNTIIRIVHSQKVLHSSTS